MKRQPEPGQEPGVGSTPFVAVVVVVGASRSFRLGGGVEEECRIGRGRRGPVGVAAGRRSYYWNRCFDVDRRAEERRVGSEVGLDSGSRS